MARIHAKDSRVYLGGRDASGDIVSVAVKLQADALEVTNFASADWRENDPGLLGFTVDLQGFYDPAVGGIGRQFETLLGASGAILSVFEGDANAIGDSGVLLGNGVLESREQPIAVADLIKLGGSIKGSGRVGYNGRLLHVLGEETGTGTGASLNNLGSSANGGRGTLHVTAITGTWTIVIEHSSDNAVGDPFATVLSFTQVAAAGGATAETVEITGTVKQYLRVKFTEDVAGSITFVCGFARY